MDTLFADVSEFQTPVDDSYLDAGYQVLSIRSNDGDYRDHNFAQNYPWMRTNLDNGRLVFGIVYCYCRPNWAETADTMIDMITTNGGLHPRVVLMLDVESGGNPGGDGSDWINRTYWRLADWLGTGGSPSPRIIGYGNVSDLDNLWPVKPAGIRLIVAGYGANPDYPGKVAHQYTDGQGYGGGLPEGASPFGNCDMNSADGLSPQDFAAACGIAPVPPPPSPPSLQPLVAIPSSVTIPAPDWSSIEKAVADAVNKALPELKKEIGGLAQATVTEVLAGAGVPTTPPVANPIDLTRASARSRATRTLLIGLGVSVLWGIVTVIGQAVDTSFNSGGWQQVVTLVVGSVASSVMSYVTRVAKEPTYYSALGVAATREKAS